MNNYYKNLSFVQQAAAQIAVIKDAKPVEFDRFKNEAELSDFKLCASGTCTNYNEATNKVEVKRF